MNIKVTQQKYFVTYWIHFPNKLLEIIENIAVGVYGGLYQVLINVGLDLSLFTWITKFSKFSGSEIWLEESIAEILSR